MVTPLITPWKRKHTQALIMQQDCTWIAVQLIWYRVIPPCWCTSSVWIPFGSPAPKLDPHSPQGVCVLINVAGPNIQELIQLWSDHSHICPPLHLHFDSPSFCLHRNPRAPLDFLCVRAASKKRHMSDLGAQRVTPTWRPLISVWVKGCVAFFHIWGRKSQSVVLRKTAWCVWTNATRICQTCTGTWDTSGNKTSAAFQIQHQCGGRK